MDEKMIDNLKSESRWLRLIFMVVFILVGYVAALLVLALAVIQALYGFVKGEPNERLLQFSGGLTQFLYQVTRFLTWHSEEKPYPFSDWPSDSVTEESSEPESDTVE